MPVSLLESAAARALDGVGDASLGEWTQAPRRVFHLRRRLSAAEVAQVGPVRDIRGTPEAGDRLQAMYPWLHLFPAGVIRDELESRA